MSAPSDDGGVRPVDPVPQSDARPTPPAKSHRCCCPPRAQIWIDVTSKSIYVENKIEIKRHFETHSAARVVPDLQVHSAADVLERTTATASANTGAPPMSAGDSVGVAKSDSKGDANANVDANSDGKTLVDEFVFKNQGKVYRTDEYTVHWRAKGDGEVDVRLDLSGVLSLHAEGLPDSGSITAVKNHLLEPAGYQPMDALVLRATIEVTDCANHVVRADAYSAHA